MAERHLSGDQKIGGILIENFFYSGKLKTAVIGIGLNISQEAFDYAPFAASLKQVSGKHFTGIRFWGVASFFGKCVVHFRF